MINKIKNMTGRIIILALMLTVIFPIGSSAEAPTMWDKYREEVKKGIILQQESIKVDFVGNEYIGTEALARIRIAKEYEKAKSEIPRYLTLLNINEKSEVTIPKLDGTSLRSATHTISYKNNKADFDFIKTKLQAEYENIKTKTTDYDKVKLAYDYIINELKQTSVGSEVKERLKPQNNNSHAVLFSIMMTDMGYENDIASSKGENPTNWNLVKVQGQWYHVDAKRDEFLVAKDESHWNIEDHEDKALARGLYDNTTPTTQQLIYEIGLIKEDVDKTSTEANKISTEEISIEQMEDVKKEFNIINKRIKDYKEIKAVLESKLNEFPIKVKYDELNVSITNLSKKIEIKERKFSNMEASIIAVNNADGDIIKNKGVLDSIIENQVSSSLNAINPSKVYNELKVKFDRIISIKNARIHLTNAETKLKNYIGVDTGVNYAFTEGKEAEKIINDIAESKYLDIQKTFYSIIAEIDKVKFAKDKVVEAETDHITKEKNDAANKAIILMNDKYASIKKNLEDRVIILEENLIEVEKNKAIKSVDDAQNIIISITKESTLQGEVINAEEKVKIAEAEVKKIKESSVRTIQQNRIKDIKLGISAMKAVDKAETSTSPSAANVKSARTAIEKIINTEYNRVKIELNRRTDTIDNKIKYIDAEKLIVKAEVSLKRTDYEKAKTALTKLNLIGDKEVELKNRSEDIEKVIFGIEAVESAEKLMKANKEKADKYEQLVTLAEENYTQANKEVDEDYKSKYGDILLNLNKRIDEIKAAILAIKEVDKAEVIYNGYLISGIDSGLVSAIKSAEDRMELINDANTNLVNIKKSLKVRLKVFGDRMVADSDYNKVNIPLLSIEKALINELVKLDKELELSIEDLEKQILGVIELSKKVKVSSQSKDIKDRTTAINDVIAATKALVQAEVRDEKTVLKDIATAKKAIEKLNIKGIHKKIEEIEQLKNVLKSRIDGLTLEVDTIANESKATSLVDKAISSKKENDIKLAIEATVKLESENQVRIELNKKIQKDIVEQLINDANDSILSTILSIERNAKTVSTNVTSTKRGVILVENVLLLIDAKLKTPDSLSYKDKYSSRIKELNNSTKIIDLAVESLNSVAQAEKTKKQEDVNTAKLAIGRVYPTEPVEPKYLDMLKELNRRIEIVQGYLVGEADTLLAAETKVSTEEKKMTVETNPISSDLRDAQDALNKVNDKVKKADLQKRIDAINLAIAAKSAVDMAEVYTDITSVKAAEKALEGLVKTNSYLDIATILKAKIGELNNQLNISKLVTEATNLVHKAVTSRISGDSIKARFAVDGIKKFVLEPSNIDDPNNPYNSLTKLLDELDESIKNEAGDQTTALNEAINALQKSIEEIHGKEASDGVEAVDGVNTDITNIVEGEDEKDSIKRAYGRIQVAKNYIIVANASARKLNGQNKELLGQIEYINKEIDLSEDNIDVKEAVRLVTLASTSVTNAKKDEHLRARGKLDIAAARRAIDKINHNDNKSIKVTILNTINSIEKKLTSDNDQELIDSAVNAVNVAADMLARAVRENKVVLEQEEIDKAIFAAKMAIGWISDNNKAAKVTLIGFINDISAMFEAEKNGIKNEERIKNAEAAVVLAESNKGKDGLESFIRSARLRVKMIDNDGPETEAKINDLNTRLDVLEGKTNTGSGSNSGNNKPGGSGTSTGNKIPTSPLPNSDRFIGSTQPIWGKTNELNKKNPVISLTPEEIKVFRIYESKLKIEELSKILNTMKGTNAKLVVRGKDINLDSKPYIHDKVNNTILVPIKSLADELGFSVKLVDGSATNVAKKLLLDGIVDGKMKSIRMDFGKVNYYANGKLVRNSPKFIIEQGRAYIPLDLLIDQFGLTFSFYDEGKNIQLIIN